MTAPETTALVWSWDNDPELAALDGTVPGSARLIVEVAVPVRWGTADPAGIHRAAVAIIRDPGYREAVWRDAQARVNGERGSYRLLGHRLMRARSILEANDQANAEIAA